MVMAAVETTNWYPFWFCEYGSWAITEWEKI